MAQPHMWPSMGVMRRSLAADVFPICRTSSRAYTNSVRRLEEQPGNGAPSTPAAGAPPNRRARSEAALRQINNLKIRRTGGPPPGSVPGGQMARRSPQAYNSSNFGASPAGPVSGDNRPASPRMAKFAARPTTTHGSAPPEGSQLVRAPGALRITRDAGPTATVGGARRGGPNLRGRSGRGRGGKGGDRDRGPKKRERKEGGAGDVRMPTRISEIDPATLLSDGMAHHLMRLQRKEWDRVPYEPKYAPGSFAAQELIHEGRELFRGEAPPVKYWGRLEKRIGVVGMFGAEAHLKVKRVPDGDDAPFGQEVEEVEEVQQAETPIEGKKQGIAAAQ